MIERRLLVCLSLACLVACGSDSDKKPSAGDGTDDAGAALGPPASAYTDPPETLDAWQLFEDEVAQKPGPRTIPYDVIAPLFSDYASKRRFLYVPEGKKIHYDPEARWKLPEGAVLIKTFSYPVDARDPKKGERLLETRLLVYTKKGVVPHTYVWNEAQTVATREIAGDDVDVSWIDAHGKRRTNHYGVPNTNECHDCHGEDEKTDTLGGRTRQLDRDFDYGSITENQIDHLAKLGLFDTKPEPHEKRTRLVSPFDTKLDLSLRARSYLDANCAHCHATDGFGSTSGMYVGFPDTAPGTKPVSWGVCKRPDSAGGATCDRQLDIIPGKPDQSIYMCRLESTDPKVQMPPLGRHLVHDEGVALIRAWIQGLEGSCD